MRVIYVVGKHSKLGWVFKSCVRFGSKDDAVEEFNKLVHKDSVDEYIGKFEELKFFMHVVNSSPSESYYISSFVSELKKDIKHMLKILKPMTLITAFEQANW